MKFTPDYLKKQSLRWVEKRLRGDPARVAPEPWWLRYRVNLPAARSGSWEIVGQGIPKFWASTPLVDAIRKHGRPMPPVWPGHYTALQSFELDADGVEIVANRVTWMSDAPNEILEQLHAIERLCGRVLFGGLGLGVMVKAAIENPDVESIEVLEVNQDIIDMVAPHFNDPRLKIHHVDARTWEPAAGDWWEVVWMDIWPYITAKNVIDMVRFRSKFSGHALWYGEWGGRWCVRKVADAMGERMPAVAHRRLHKVISRSRPRMARHIAEGSMRLAGVL